MYCLMGSYLWALAAESSQVKYVRVEDFCLRFLPVQTFGSRGLRPRIPGFIAGRGLELIEGVKFHIMQRVWHYCLQIWVYMVLVLKPCFVGLSNNEGSFDAVLVRRIVACLGRHRAPQQFAVSVLWGPGLRVEKLPDRG